MCVGSLFQAVGAAIENEQFVMCRGDDGYRTVDVCVMAVVMVNKNLCGRDGQTICGPQCVPKSTSMTLAVDEKTLPMATITGRTDRQTDRQSATQYAAPS